MASDWAYYGLVGVGPGAMLGLLALGLVLVHRSTGVLNVAHTSQAAVGAYLYADLSGRGLSLWASVLLATVLAGATGVVIQIVVMRPLRDSSPLTLLIATSGLLLLIQSSLLLHYGSDPRNVRALLPGNAFRLWGDRSIGVDRLMLVVIAIVLTTALWFVYRFTTYGVKSAAVAENPLAGQTLGLDANRLAIGNWFLGGATAGLAGCLLAPISGLSLTVFLSLLVPVLAAALGGGLVSFPLTLAGGIVIGIAQAEVTAHSDQRGGASIATFVILVVVMVLRGQAIPARGFTGARLPSLGSGRIRWWLVLLATVVALAMVWWVLPVEWNQAALTSMLVALPMLSLVVVTGYAGQVSLAQFALSGVGAVVAAQIGSAHPAVPFLLLLVIGAAAGIPTGYLLAYAARRMRGASLSVITLGFNVLLFATVFSRSEVVIVPQATIFGIDLTALIDPRRYLTLVLVVFVLLAIVVANCRRSQIGRRMVAVRGNERAAAALGISVNGTKSLAFVISAVIAAAGGVLLAFRSTAVSYTNFDSLSSVSQLGWTVIGGIGYVAGPLLGMTFASGGLGNQLIASVYNDQFAWLPFVGAVLLLLTILQNPDGLSSVNIAAGRRLLAWTRQRREPPVRPESSRPRGPDVLPGSKRTRVRRALELQRVDMSFGAVDVLKSVSLRVEPGQVHGLIGPNGAGKTTLLDVVSGYARPQAGEISLGEISLNSLPTWRRARLGIGRSFQSLELFEDLSVYDNIRVASEMGSTANIVRDLTAPVDASLSPSGWDAVELLGLAGGLDRRISELSYGKRHLVAIARALASDSDIVLLDEPAAGLDDNEAGELRGLIRRIVDTSGVGILLIEHDVELVMSVSDRVTALNFGDVIASGPPQEVRQDPAVVAAYLGSECRDAVADLGAMVPELGGAG